MDAQRGHAQEGSLDVNEPPLKAAPRLCDNEHARQRQIAVKPRVPQPAAVAFNAQLHVARALERGHGLDFQNG